MEAVPKKLLALLELCKSLAFKTWDQCISVLLQELIKGNQKQEDKWQKKELVLALCIFIFYNSMACFSMGNGVCNEIDLDEQTGSLQDSFQSAQNYSPRK